MLSEVSDIFRVREVFFSCIYRRSILSVYRNIDSKKERPTFIMKLFEMMDFVLIFVIAVVSWPSLPFHEIVSVGFVTVIAMAAVYLAKRTQHQI